MAEKTGRNFSSKVEETWEEFKVEHVIKDETSRLTVQILNAKGNAIVSGKEYPQEKWGIAFAFEGRPGRLSYYHLDHWHTVAALTEKAMLYVESKSGVGSGKV